MKKDKTMVALANLYQTQYIEMMKYFDYLKRNPKEMKKFVVKTICDLTNAPFDLRCEMLRKIN